MDIWLTCGPWLIFVLFCVAGWRIKTWACAPMGLAFTGICIGQTWSMWMVPISSLIALAVLLLEIMNASDRLPR